MKSNWILFKIVVKCTWESIIYVFKNGNKKEIVIESLVQVIDKKHRLYRKRLFVKKIFNFETKVYKCENYTKEGYNKMMATENQLKKIF